MEWHDTKESLPPVNHDVMVTVDCEGEKSVLSNLKFDGRQWTIKVPFIMGFAVFLKSEYITHWMDMPLPALGGNGLTVEQIEDTMVEHFTTDGYMEQRGITDITVEKIRDCCKEFIDDCLERHPEVRDNIKSAIVEWNADGVNIIYHDKIVGMMKWGRSI